MAITKFWAIKNTSNHDSLKGSIDYIVNKDKTTVTQEGRVWEPITQNERNDIAAILQREAGIVDDKDNQNTRTKEVVRKSVAESLYVPYSPIQDEETAGWTYNGENKEDTVTFINGLDNKAVVKVSSSKNYIVGMDNDKVIIKTLSKKDDLFYLVPRDAVMQNGLKYYNVTISVADNYDKCDSAGAVINSVPASEILKNYRVRYYRTDLSAAEAVEADQKRMAEKYHRYLGDNGIDPDYQSAVRTYDTLLNEIEAVKFVIKKSDIIKQTDDGAVIKMPEVPVLGENNKGFFVEKEMLADKGPINSMTTIIMAENYDLYDLSGEKTDAQMTGKDVAAHYDIASIKRRGYNPGQKDMKNEHDYIARDSATDNGRLVSIIGAGSAEEASAYIHMAQSYADECSELTGVTLSRAENVGYHMLQAFDPDDPVTPDEAHQMGVLFYDEMFKDKYQAVVATHIDKAHIHNHIVFSAVGYPDMKRFKENPRDVIKRMRAINDRICLDHGLGIIKNPGKEITKSYDKWLEYNQESSWKYKCKQDLQEILDTAISYDEFAIRCKDMGILFEEFKPNKKLENLDRAKKKQYTGTDLRYSVVLQVDGKKYARQADGYWLGSASDKSPYTKDAVQHTIAANRKKFGLPVEPARIYNNNLYTDVQTVTACVQNNAGMSYHARISFAVDNAICNSDTYDDFKMRLDAFGIEIKDDLSGAYRLKKNQPKYTILGSDYCRQNVEMRIRVAKAERELMAKRVVRATTTDVAIAKMSVTKKLVIANNDGTIMVRLPKNLKAKSGNKVPDMYVTLSHQEYNDLSAATYQLLITKNKKYTVHVTGQADVEMTGSDLATFFENKGKVHDLDKMLEQVEMQTDKPFIYDKPEAIPVQIPNEIVSAVTKDSLHLSIPGADVDDLIIPMDHVNYKDGSYTIYVAEKWKYEYINTKDPTIDDKSIYDYHNDLRGWEIKQLIDELNPKIVPTVVRVPQSAIKFVSAAGDMVLKVPEAGIESMYIDQRFVTFDPVSQTASLKVYDNWKYEYKKKNDELDADGKIITPRMEGSDLAKKLLMLAPDRAYQTYCDRFITPFYSRAQAQRNVQALARILLDMDKNDIRMCSDFDRQLDLLRSQLRTAENQIDLLEKKADAVKYIAGQQYVVKRNQPVFDQYNALKGKKKAAYEKEHAFDLKAYAEAMEYLQKNKIDVNADVIGQVPKINKDIEDLREMAGNVTSQIHKCADDKRVIESIIRSGRTVYSKDQYQDIYQQPQKTEQQKRDEKKSI